MGGGVEETCWNHCLSWRRGGDMAPFLLVSDIDDTLVGHGKPGADAALASFADLWTKLRAEGCVLVYNTGRSFDSFEQLSTEVPLLPQPDIFVGSVGTQMVPTGTDREAMQQLCTEWSQQLTPGWSVEAVTSAIDAALVQWPSQ